MNADIKWIKIESPVPWKPKTVGEELFGYFLGVESYTGRYGDYQAVLVGVPTSDGFCVSRRLGGQGVIKLILGASIDIGKLIRIVYDGTKDVGQANEMKVFDVFVSNGKMSTSEAFSYSVRNETRENPGASS